MVFHFRPDAASGSGEGGWGDIEGEGRGEGETIGGKWKKIWRHRGRGALFNKGRVKTIICMGLQDLATFGSIKELVFREIFMERFSSASSSRPTRRA